MAHDSARSPWLRRIVVVVVVLAILLVGADRGGDWLAERMAADNLQSSQHLPSRPDVDIHGVPFLTQFAAGHYDHISVDAADLPVARGAFRLTTLHVDLNQLQVSRGFSSFHVTSATADAYLDYAALSDRLGIHIAYAGSNRIKASKMITLPVVGTITPTISLVPQLVNGALTFGKSTINGAGDNLDAVSSVLTKIFDVNIPLDGIPFQMKVRSLYVNASGLRMNLVGSDLTFTRS